MKRQGLYETLFSYNPCLFGIYEELVPYNDVSCTRVGGERMSKQNLVSNTIILSGSSLVIRAIGMLTILYLSHQIGAEGIGVYQIIMSVYTAGVVFAR